jgi:hypothetical protein
MEDGGTGWGLRAMEPKSKSTPELILEAEEAHRLADLTIGVGEELLERVIAVSHRIEERVRRATAEERLVAFGER